MGKALNYIQSEAVLDNSLVQTLLDLGYEKISIPDEDTLLANFKNQKYGGNEFLVGYKFNLLTIAGLSRGETLYIKIVDTKLENWAIIKIDDIKTFNITEPSNTTYDTVLNQLT